MNPLVTIGIPAFERRAGLRRAVDTARTQTYQNVEILVSDNCSQSYDVYSELSADVLADPRVTIFRQDKNIGGFENFKFLCNRAEGAYFVLMADDDDCAPNFVETLVKAALTDPEIVLCASDVIIIDKDDGVLARARLEEVREDVPWLKARRLFFRYPTSNIFFCAYGMFLTATLRAVQSELRASWKDFATNVEVPFLAKVATLGRIVSVPAELKSYRSHVDSTYGRESGRATAFDRFCIRTIIRFRLLAIIFSAKIPVSERLFCTGLVSNDGLKAEIREVLRVFYTTIRTGFDVFPKSRP